MATIYNAKIKMVSPWANYDEKYISKMFARFLADYKDETTGLGFESVEIEVDRK